MKNLLQSGLLVAGALIAYNAFAKGTALQTLNFYPKAVNNIKFDGATPVMQFSLAIQNTSNQSMVVKSLVGNLYSNDYYIGNIASYIPTRINANSETILILSVRLSLIGIVSDIINCFNGNGFSQDLEFQANANVNKFQIPINIKYKVG